MRNRDRIKELEHELGRYQKKVGDQQKEISKLNSVVANDKTVHDARGKAFELFMKQVAIEFGEVVKDEDDGDKIIGYRLEMPVPVASETDKFNFRDMRDEESHTYKVWLELKWEDDH